MATETTELKWDPDDENEGFYAKDLHAWYFPGEYDIPREHVETLLREDGWEKVEDNSNITPISGSKRKADSPEDEEDE